MSGITYAPAYYDKYEGRYTFPSFAEGLGWLMVVSPLALIVGGAIVQSIRYGGVSSSLQHHLLSTCLFFFFISKCIASLSYFSGNLFHKIFGQLLKKISINRVNIRFYISAMCFNVTGYKVLAK